MESLTFYFDFISPNAYLAWKKLPALAERHGRVLHPEPVLFAAILDEYGQLGPAEISLKMQWMVRNVLRKAARDGIPIAPPATHPFNPLLALRAAGQPLKPRVRNALIERLFNAVWRDSLDVSDPAVVADLADELGLDGRAIVAATQTEGSKERLKESTAAAIRRGVFGVPTMIADGEVFWGYDDLDFLERFLRGEDTLPDVAAWRRVRPSARRSR